MSANLRIRNKSIANSLDYWNRQQSWERERKLKKLKQEQREDKEKKEEA